MDDGGCAMLTLFSIPKYFKGHFNVIQRNAILSWTRLVPKPEIMIMGQEPGTAEFCQEHGLIHVPHVETNPYGTPLLRDLFQKAHQLASHDTLCFINADLILTRDFMPAVGRILERKRKFLMIGERWDYWLEDLLDFNNPSWETELLAKARRWGIKHGFSGVDYFVFSKGTFGDIPPLVIGRKYYDTWLIWKAYAGKADVIDATGIVTCIHQEHDRTYSAMGKMPVQGTDCQRENIESQENLAYAGGNKDRLFNLLDATHRMTPRKISRAFGLKYLRRRWKTLPGRIPRLKKWVQWYNRGYGWIIRHTPLRFFYAPMPVPRKVMDDFVSEYNIDLSQYLAHKNLLRIRRRGRVYYKFNVSSEYVFILQSQRRRKIVDLYRAACSLKTKIKWLWEDFSRNDNSCFERTGDWVREFKSPLEFMRPCYHGIYPEAHRALTDPKTLSHGLSWEVQRRVQRCQEAFVAEIPQGLVWGNSGAVLTPDHKLLMDVSYELGRPPVRHSFFERAEKFRPKTIQGTAAVLATAGGGYFHWMLGVLPRFHLLQKSGIPLDEVDVFIMNRIYEQEAKYKIETMGLLGIPRDKIIECHPSFYAQAVQLIVPSLSWWKYNLSPWAVEFLRQTFLKPGDVSARRRIYISREDAKKRKLTNETEVVGFLEPYGFEKVVLGKMSVAEQTSLFDETEVVVGPNGAGFANLAFCREKAKVIELFPENYINPSVWTLSNQIKLDYYYIAGKVDPLQSKPESGRSDQDFSIDLADLKDILEKADVKPMNTTETIEVRHV
ncbi:MAG: glycosyltransferase family 61 protein [Candidatus Omnitrophica bacterium]|nr:glycosyltransferase family 61 protein [Candidatus Omnitrophota bacterium]MDD5671188.1 glycosyltransferase family 61 protein [Candidatus Omnitrophota bacterium]